MDAPPPNAAATADEAAGARARQVELILSQLDALPTLSSVATRVMALTSSDDSSGEQIGTLIESDPALSARILSLCRRASVAMPAGITTVRKAVVMLGLEAVQAAVLSLEIYEVMGQMPGSGETREPPSADSPLSAGFDRVGFWQHSIAVACAAELLAEGGRELNIRPEEAFTAGLIHDLGKLVLDWVLPRTYARVIQTAEARNAPLAQVERAALGLDHHVVGKRLAERWSLPHALQDCMWLHGQEFSALPEVRHRTLIALITLADAIARRQHLGWSGEFTEPPALGPLITALGLSPPRVAEVAPRLHQEVAKRAADLGLDEQTAPQLVTRSIAEANQRLARLHSRCRERSAESRRQASVLQAIGRFTARSRPGASVNDVLAEIVSGFRSLAGAGFAATLYQAREGEPWRLSRFHADGTPAPATLIDQPRDAEGQPIDLRHLDHGESLGGAIGLLTWLSEHLGAGPDLRRIRVVPLISGVGPAAVLLHDRPAADFAPTDPAHAALASAWAWAIAAATQHDGARRLTEQLASTTRALSQTQAELAEAQSMARLGELTAGAAHELNNPLTVISGRSQLLAQRLHNSRDRGDAQQIADAAQRLSDLVTTLHHVARPPQPDLKMIEPADILAPAIRRASDRYATAHPGLPAPKIKILAQIPPGTPLRADRDMVIRALSELILNALEAAGVSTVLVRAHLDAATMGEPARLVFTVKDDGAGLSDHAQTHAFDPFFSEKPAGRQAGLGLPLARRLAEAHKGAIRLDSTPGKGATALLTLPLSAAGFGSGSGKSTTSRAA
jgi:signal transduction histidine kinase/HD-like signal output (HDOD) protein